MEHTLIMSSTSPGISIRTNDKLLEMNRVCVRLEPAAGPCVLGDGRFENAQPVVDENEEWAKIENIMASLDAGLNHSEVGLNGASMPYIGRKCINNSNKSTPTNNIVADIHSVRQWLDSLGLSRLEDILIANGFDDMNFLGPNVLSDSDLIEIGVISTANRHKILSAAAKLPPFNCHAPKQFSSLASWLAALRLSEYVETFQVHGFTTLDRLHNLWDVELTSVLHVSRLGHRNRIMAAIGALPPQHLPLKDGNFQLDSQPELSSSVDKQSLNDVSLFKDYTTLLRTRSKTSQSLTAGSEHPKQKLAHQNSSSIQPKHDMLRIRPPQSSGSDIKQWSHQPDVLLNGSCSYQVMYVGHGIVDCFNNTSATHEAILAIKEHCAKTLRGATKVQMCISHTGVELIKLTSKEMLGSYSIGNIFCVSQDVEHLDYFAFVTFQPAVNLHYCHVFCAETIQLAVEVVLTLGQAFEVAYQLAIQENGALGDANASQNRQLSNNLVKNVHMTNNHGSRSADNADNSGLVLNV